MTGLNEERMREPATHVFCRKCDNFVLAKWEKVKIATTHYTFDGLEAICETCGEDVTMVGNLKKQSAIAAE